MSAKKNTAKPQRVKALPPPNVSNKVWFWSSLAGAVLILMALLQLISFSDFKDALEVTGVSGAGFWGIIIILAELWGAAGFFKAPLSFLFRRVSYTLAILVAGFWFVNNLQLVAGAASSTTNSAFFGRFLSQSPSWWTVIEVSILLFWVSHKVHLLLNSSQAKKRK